MASHRPCRQGHGPASDLRRRRKPVSASGGRSRITGARCSWRGSLTTAARQNLCPCLRSLYSQHVPSSLPSLTVRVGGFSFRKSADRHARALRSADRLGSSITDVYARFGRSILADDLSRTSAVTARMVRAIGSDRKVMKSPFALIIPCRSLVSKVLPRAMPITMGATG